MTSNGKDSIYPFFHCSDCDKDIVVNDTSEYLEHKDHKIVRVEQGEIDPSLGKEFLKKGLSIPEKENTAEKTVKKNLTEKDMRNERKKLYDYVLSKISRLVISESNQNDVIAIIQTDSHLETITLSTIRARYWVTYQYSILNPNDIHSEEFYKGVLHAIRSKAQMNGTLKSKVYNRIAQLENVIYYDLGTPNWDIIRVTKDGIDIIPFGLDLPIFRRSQTLSEQVMPVFDNEKALDKCVELLKIVNEDRLVFKVHLVSMFLEAYPVPMMVFTGNAGSLKSTLTASVKRIVDPSGKSREDNTGTMNSKNDDLIIQLHNRYLSSFDNVSKIESGTSDVFCRAITGSSNPKRELYTNADETILNYRRKIVLNGIVPSLDYPDLMQRTVFYSRETIDETNRMSEEEFERRFSTILPSVFGQILSTLSKAMQIYHDVKKEVKPQSRMADFEIWGEAISRSLGNENNQFLYLYHEKLKEGTLNAKDHYPVVDIIQEIMINKEQLESTMSSLYKTIREEAKNEGLDIDSKYVHFPKTDIQLSKELKIITPLLNNLGFVIEMWHNTKNNNYKKNASIISIKRKNIQSRIDEDYGKPSAGHDGSKAQASIVSSPSSLANLDQKQEQDMSKNSENADKTTSPIFYPEQVLSEDGEDGEDGFQKYAQDNSHDITINTHTHFICEICKAGPFDLKATTKSSGSILEFHQKMGHAIKYMTESEVQQYFKML